MNKVRVGSAFAPDAVEETLVQEVDRNPQTPMRSLDEALDAAIRANVRLDPRKGKVTPEMLGITVEEARHFGRQLVAALMAREQHLPHADPVDTAYWAHTPMVQPEPLDPSKYLAFCSCGWTSLYGGRYEVIEQHNKHRKQNIEEALVGVTRSPESDRGWPGRSLPGEPWGVRGTGPVQHPVPQMGAHPGPGERVPQREMGPVGVLAHGLLSERRYPLRPNQGPETGGGSFVEEDY